MLDVCLQMNIHCVSAYAFSIENFKRPPEEVDALMALAEEKLLELCNKGYAGLFCSSDCTKPIRPRCAGTCLMNMVFD